MNGKFWFGRATSRTMILDKVQLLETEQMFRDAGEQCPVIIPEAEIRQTAPGTKSTGSFFHWKCITLGSLLGLILTIDVVITPGFIDNWIGNKTAGASIAYSCVLVWMTIELACDYSPDQHRSFDGTCNSLIDDLLHEAKLYRINWHYKHFWKEYIFLDRYMYGKDLGGLVVIFLDRLVVIFLDGCVWKIFG
ncbi:hypothetical protein ACSBR2_014851 [Camellia fascicularis]